MVGYIVVAVVSMLVGIRIGGVIFSRSLGRAETRAQMRRARGVTRFPWF